MGSELVRRSDQHPKTERRPGDVTYVISITSNTLQPADEKQVPALRTLDALLFGQPQTFFRPIEPPGAALHFRSLR